MDLKQALGFDGDQSEAARETERHRLIDYINLQLAAHGLPTASTAGDTRFLQLARGLLENHREKRRLLRDQRCPADRRIEAFLQRYFADVELDHPLRLPPNTLNVDRHGMARELSLPVNGDDYQGELVQSYRVRNGVLHNPKHDRRTTAGTFHVAEGGLPIPGDKRAVPALTFARLFQAAVTPPVEQLRLPFGSQQSRPIETFIGLLLRPLVCPAVHGVTPDKTLEIRFFAPGTLVSNIDFVESIFGNAGDPSIPENDAALDVEHWTGHTGAVILAPHMTQLTKRELGLPHIDDATERQRQDRMCWSDASELYNDGQPFKATCRDSQGVVVTLIADNYFGYCKKEVKTQTSFAANLFGNVEEEHAGGALLFPGYNLGDDFQVNSRRYNGRTLEDVFRDYGGHIQVDPSGFGIDRHFPELIYIHESARADLNRQKITWTGDGVEQSMPLLPGKVYMAPSGYQLRMEKHPSAPSWRIIGTAAEGIFCHKPCTVSGGGKSEISKSLRDYMHYGPVFVGDLEREFDRVDEIFSRDYSDRWRADSSHRPDYSHADSRSVLDPERTLGSVIKLLTPSADYTQAYNAWLDSIPNHVYALVFIIKRFMKPSWQNNWREHFGVDIINGEPGHELKYHERILVGTYLRVGLLGPQSWRTYKVRQDFAAAQKVQMEDDISASIVVPAERISQLGRTQNSGSVKFARNCEYRLFQRPDDAIHRGLDKQTESDLARPDNFISNFEPLTREQVQEMTRYVVDFDAFSPPMQNMLRSVIESNSSYVVCSANPRRIDGKPTKNPRYLQDRPDLADPAHRYIAEMGARLFRAVPGDQPVQFPVGAVLMGRRNNPPDRSQGIPGLAVYGPLHYQELPELFMDIITSLTGKSPSTTGFGSEGALTKAPFNALLPTIDLNAALCSSILTGMAGFSTAAGHIGPNVQVDHDLSLVIPEVWCRMTETERDPRFLIEEQFLEPLKDYEHQGRTIPASRLGYRINTRFMRRFFGRVFDNPGKVFDQAILQPETQDPDAFAEGITYICEAQQRVARQYLQDGSFEMACPPLQALLMIMAEGSFQGHSIHDREVRDLFTREALLQSDWYRARLQTKQQRDIALWERHLANAETTLQTEADSDPQFRTMLESRRDLAREELQKVSAAEYLDSLVGTIGANPL